MTFNRLARLLALTTLFALSLVGCTRVSDHLTINADGSGSVVITTTLNDAMDELDPHQRRMMMGEIPSMSYPPMNADEAAILFPGDAFNIEEESQTEEDLTTNTVTVTFKSVNDLLTTPYANARSLAIDLDPETKRLTVRSRTGLQPAAALAELRNSIDDEAAMARDMIEIDEEQLKQIEDNFQATFTITLPADVSADDQAKADGQSAEWKIIRTDFESNEAFSAKTRQLMTATCASENITFTPAMPTRLDLSDFDTLSVTPPSKKNAPAIDSQEVRDSVQVTPLAVMSKRVSSYTGRGWGGDSHGLVSVVITLPKKYEPLRWGEFNADTITDDLDADLIQSDEDGYSSYANRYDMDNFYGGFESENPKPKKEIDHFITIQFKTPDIAATQIKTLTGSINALYGGSPRIIKLPAVITDISSDSYNREGVESTELLEAGIELRISSTDTQGPVLSISTNIESEDSLVKEIQVFDSDGQPWPTYQQANYGGGSSQHKQIIVIGQPKPPLSLAILVDAANTRVQIPVELTDLPLTEQTKEEGE